MQIDGYLRERREVKGSKRWSCLYMMGKNKIWDCWWNYGCFLWSGRDDWESSISFFDGQKKGGERERERRYFTQFFEN